MWKSFVLELHGEWCEFGDECIALLAQLSQRSLVRKGDYSAKCFAFHFPMNALAI
jgi:hypothetical protein